VYNIQKNKLYNQLPLVLVYIIILNDYVCLLFSRVIINQYYYVVTWLTSHDELWPFLGACRFVLFAIRYSVVFGK